MAIMRGLAACCAILAGVLCALPAAAATVTVPGSYPTIQAAIDGAPDGSVIQIAPGVYHEHLVLSSISRTLTLRGNPSNPSTVVVDGSGKNDTIVLVISCDSNLTIEGITVRGGRGGHDGYGGGLFMAKSGATFRHCVFQDNRTQGDGGGAFVVNGGGVFEDCVFDGNSAGRYGGGVLVNGSHNGASPIVFNRCQFVNNVSGTADAVQGWGAGLYVTDSSPLIIGSLIQGNVSKYAAGGIALLGHDGTERSVMTVVDTIVANNQASPGGSPARADGGGIHVEANATLQLERSWIHDNVAHSGGGISLYQAVVDVRDSLIEGNQATPLPGIASYGGGVWASSVSTSVTIRPASVVSIARSTVRNNTADIAAGLFAQGDFSGLTSNTATLTIGDSIVAGNTASSDSAGVLVDRATATITRSHLLDNRALGTWGGGLSAIGSSVVRVEDTTIAGNQAATLGGGILLDQGSNLVVTGSRIVHNRASTTPPLGGGAIAATDIAGPTADRPTGSVTNSILGDNGVRPQIWEASCDAAHRSTITYQNNTISGDVYFRNCDPGASTVAQFNAIPGKASGNTVGVPSFASFAAAPTSIRSGWSSVLAATAPNVGSLSVNGGVGALTAPADTADVSPAATTTYTLSPSAGPSRQARVSVLCASVGTPVPLTPANGNQYQPPGDVRFSWSAAPGATAYDVYLDGTDEPTTLVASDVVETSVTVPNVAPAAQYHWKVVAKSPACTEPVPSPIATFRTCSGSSCRTCLTFDDGSVTGWGTRGRGGISLSNGALLVTAKRKLTLTPPLPPLSEGEVSMNLTFTSPRRLMKLYFGYQGPSSYNQLVIGRSSRVKIQSRNGRSRRGASAKRLVPAGQASTLRLLIAGGIAKVALDGEQVLSTPLVGTPSGGLVLEAVGTTLLLDDLCVDRQ